MVCYAQCFDLLDYLTNKCPALFKLKSNADPKRVQLWQDVAHSMVGKVPGLMALEAGPPLEFTAHMAKGFDMGVVLLVDYIESLATFFTHPSHDEYVPQSLPRLLLVLHFVTGFTSSTRRSARMEAPSPMILSFKTELNME